MTLAEFITVAIAFAALALGVRSYFRDERRDEDTAKVETERHAFEQRMTGEAVTIQRKLADIEAERHRWELEERNHAAAEREQAEEQARSATFQIRFAYRDSAQTWARIVATNDGKADAYSVRLAVLAQTREEDLVEVEPVGGTDYRVADRLQTGESVHTGVAFSLGFPQPSDLRYRLAWVDTNGEQEQEGRVPID